jgi:hypothetical protein
MCTVTWLFEECGYQLFCNRDEKFTRQPALPPRIQTRDQVRFIAPEDGDHGGAWIATNEFGVTVCLLNGPASPPPEMSRSRGLLVLDLVTFPSTTQIREHMQVANLSVYPPFTLAVIEPGKPALLVEWNSSRRTISEQRDRQFMLTSSSFDSGRVIASRQEYYASVNGSPSIDRLRAFHQSHPNGPSAYSVCMHRPDAETVSFSHIRVSTNEAEFLYSPAALCKASATMSLKLNRRFSSGAIA